MFDSLPETRAILRSGYNGIDVAADRHLKELVVAAITTDSDAASLGG